MSPPARPPEPARPLRRLLACETRRRHLSNLVDANFFRTGGLMRAVDALNRGPGTENTIRPARAHRSLVAAWAGVTVGLLAAGCGSASSGARTSGPPTVTVNAATQYQHMAGFGVSEGFGQAKTLMSAPVSVQRKVLGLLYSPTRGAGLTVLRNEISADAGFSIEPRRPSGPNAKPSYLTLAEIGQDQGQLWLAKQIKVEYDAGVFADAWSAPAFMKTNDSARNGGTVCGAPGARCSSGDWRQAYADYLVRYAEDYAAAGVPLSYIGPENEPNLGVGQDSMIMSPAQTADFMAILGATLRRSGLSTRAECCASISWSSAQRYAATIEADKAANSATALFTSHGYFAAPDSLLRGWRKPAWETEWAPFGFAPWDPAWDDGSPSSGFAWAQNIDRGLTGADLSAFLYLWGADTTGMTGPNTGLVQVKGDTVAASGRLWAFAGYSRFIRPGAVRIEAATRRASLGVSAFHNTDGSTIVVVLNRAHRRQDASFSLRGVRAGSVAPYLTDATHNLSAQTPIAISHRAFTSALPARSLDTYDIRP
jgi:O-glycosyl hydrolase